MGKKAKKKARAPPPKEKRIPNVPQENDQCGETVDDGVSLVNEKKPCSHIDKGFDLNALSAKVGSPELIKCEDCREGAIDRRGNSGKGKHGKKNKSNSSVDSKSKSKAIWICLECGHYGCGGVGLPTIPQSHAVRHARLTHHPLAIQLEKPSLRWCFSCSAYLSMEKTEDSNSEAKDVFLEVVKLIKGRATKNSEVDVENVWFGGSSVTSEVTPRAEAAFLGNLDERRNYYVARGLVNLGNTCFFNSVMQNLLSMDRLRDYFMKLNTSVGPLTVSLKKLFSEIKGEEGKKITINPRSLFGSVCSKAPQFRGYQQHDSHELLRCLLDILSTEESEMRKQINEKEDGKSPPDQSLTFVDSVFGGQISSTVCCLECGHSSTVYEPFLDLSLPVPTKKPPPKKTQPTSRANKAKVLPKRGNRARTKAIVTQNVSSKTEPSCGSQSCTPVSEGPEASSGDFTLRNPVDSTANANERGSVLQDCGTNKDGESRSALENTMEQTDASDKLAWLDYLDPEPAQDEIDSSSKDSKAIHAQDAVDDFSWMDYLCLETVSHDTLPSQDVDAIPEDVELQNCSESSNKGTAVADLQSDSLLMNSCEKEPLPQVQDSEVLLLPYKEDGQMSAQTENESDFVGFGDLFAEPDNDSGQVRDTCLGPENEVAESGFMAGNSSESDPGEVDNSDSPVSVESCLAHFTKSELLSNDNAWHCEKCSKTLHLETKIKKQAEDSTLDLSGSENTLELEVRSTSNDSEIDHSVNSHHGVAQNRESSGNEGKIGGIQETSDTLSCSNSFSEANFSDRTTEIHGIDELSSTGCSVPEVQQEDDETEKPIVMVKREATKRTLIFKAPPILTIHLKRFSQDTRGRLSKLSGHIDFRESIDLRPYMGSRAKDKENCIYRLTGVVEHLGTMRSGHYVAYIRGGDKSKEDGSSVWYHVSDAYVREVPLEEVLRSEAYILFYEMS